MTRIPERNAVPTAAGTARRPRRIRWIALATAASLLVATPALAQTGAWGRGMGPGGAQADGYRGMPGMRGDAYVHGRFMDGARMPGRFPGRGGVDDARMHGGFMHGGLAQGTFMQGAFMQGGFVQGGALHRLPLGTEVTVETFAGDPAEGAEPVATLTLTVGEDSEAAFAEQVAAARADAAFLRTTLGERTRRVELADAAPFTGRPGVRSGAMAGATAGAMPGAMFGAMGVGGLEDGQTVTVAVFAAADDAAPSASLSFTYGVDSAAAFHAQLQDALEGAAAVEVTLPERVRTVDLSADAAWRPGPFGGRPAWR